MCARSLPDSYLRHWIYIKDKYGSLIGETWLASPPALTASMSLSAAAYPAIPVRIELYSQCLDGGLVIGPTCRFDNGPYQAGLQHIIWQSLDERGPNDSAQALRSGLSSAGFDAIVISDLLDYGCLDLFASQSLSRVLWALLGAFPSNHVMTAAEGQKLVDVMSADVSIYVEGGDHWGFDPVTPFESYDGVENDTALDGDESFTSMDGAAYAELDLISYVDVLYNQGVPGSDWVDHILPVGSSPGVPVDFPGPNAGTVWRNNPDAPGELDYSVGVCYKTDSVPSDAYGDVLAQSWELGGFVGPRDALVAQYAAALLASGAARFIRGDCNDDGNDDLSDAITILGSLFFPGTPAPVCLEACDVNDDSAFNISDAIFDLAALFVPGSPTPAPPYPNCGVDPQPPGLGCVDGLCP